jgi:Helicase conserved C-terminal domain/SNF2-related domain
LASLASSAPRLGDFVELRGRPWLVEGTEDKGSGLTALQLSCISDDAQGERLDVVWEAEIAPGLLEDDVWARVGQNGADDPAVFAAYLRTLKWNTATAADRDLFQAPFRAGIRLDAYQLLPLRKALRLPRVNLLIADDVGLGKTIEAGLILRELLLRRRIDFTVVAAPPSMTLQWQDELEAKFGLAFTIIDRERLADLRRLRGFAVNPWSTGSRFIISHRLLPDETYVAGLRALLHPFRSRALLILDEAHHAAPASGVRYAVDSQFTKAARELAALFEHRLFLSATPHNGHSNSFSSLLEMLDPQRFTRGVEVRPRDLEPVMVRRLKSDLRWLGEAFPERVVEPIVLTDLPEAVPELALARTLSAYGALRARRIARLPPRAAAQAKLVFVGLQQRLLSSVAAFARTLSVHRRALEEELGKADGATSVDAPGAVAQGFVRDPGLVDEQLPLEIEEADAEKTINADEDAATETASALGNAGAVGDELRAELQAVDAMLDLAKQYAQRPDARVAWLVEWIRRHMMQDGRWNERRLILFTEFEDTRRWLERRLLEALDGTDRIDERVGVFTGATGTDRREAVKRAFNADPAVEPLRILICTDAAREGINLQTHCHDLIHVDLPWNPSRLEQRNGRIDRKLQPAEQVFCRYFRYAQREEDIVLEALVWKTERIRTQLGSAGQVIEERIAARLASSGIERGQATALAEAVRDEADYGRLSCARAEMDDEEQARRVRLLRDLDDLRKILERSRERVGVTAQELEQVVGVALGRAGASLTEAKATPVGTIDTFRFDPGAPAFANDPGWLDAFDDLRRRPRQRGEALGVWRRAVPIRAVSFAPPILPDGTDATDVVQVHLEHRLVRRLLSRFLSLGFQSKLERICVIFGPGAQPRVVVLGRLALYGAGAARLHEEMILTTAVWTEADRATRPLRPLGARGEDATLEQLERALSDAREPPAQALARVRALAPRDARDLEPELRRRAEQRLAAAAEDLVGVGEREAASLAQLLEAQRQRIAKAASGFDPNQLALPGVAESERRQLERNRRHWDKRLAEIEREAVEEPARLRASYEVRAHRLEPVGLVYLWPASG